MPWSHKYLYAVPKLEKIVFGVQSFRDKLLSYTTMIWPDDEHALPIYSFYWAESRRGSYFLLDFYPAADCIVDLPYMQKYLEPLEDIYAKGVRYFPQEVPGRTMNWFRALHSPYLVIGDFGPSTQETQSRVLELATGYLEIYFKLWEDDRPRDATYMKPLISRREAIRNIFREQDPGSLAMIHAVGDELAQFSLETLF
jgi:hypothetical protein